MTTLEEFEDFRNARGRLTVDRARSVFGAPPPTAIVGRADRARGTAVDVVAAAKRGPVLRADTGGLSYGVLIDAAAQVLAAIQSLPTPPSATGCARTA